MSTAQTATKNEWSTDDRARVIECYRDHGLSVAHHETGVPRTTLRRWAVEAGLDPRSLNVEATARTAAAREARQARCDALRLEVREQFLLEAAAALDRLSEPYVEFIGQLGAEVVYPVPPAAASFQLMKTAGTALDKYRLELGEATELHGIAGDVSEVESMRDELAKRRLARAS